MSLRNNNVDDMTAREESAIGRHRERVPDESHGLGILVKLMQLVKEPCNVQGLAPPSSMRSGAPYRQ